MQKLRDANFFRSDANGVARETKWNSIGGVPHFIHLWLTSAWNQTLIEALLILWVLPEDSEEGKEQMDIVGPSQL
jgi:hypothetical protein